MIRLFKWSYFIYTQYNTKEYIMKRIILLMLVSISLFSFACTQNAEKYNEQGLEKQKLGNNKEAINLFTKAISVDQYYAESYINRGNAYYDFQNYYEAISDDLFVFLYAPIHFDH